MARSARVMLQTDDSFFHQTEFIKAFDPYILDIQEMSKYVRLYGSKGNRNKVFNTIQNNLSEKYNNNSPLLTFMGSGDFHHLSLPLLFLANNFMTKQFSMNNSLKPAPKLTLIHIDNHPDWVKDPIINCGSWISHALNLPFIDKIISIGANSKDLVLPEFKRANLNALKTGKLVLFPLNKQKSWVFKNYSSSICYNQNGRKLQWKTLNSFPKHCLFELISPLINTDYVYISFDKDVLSQDNQITNWDNGNLDINKILLLIQFLCNNYKITGIDITGDYSPPVDKGNLFILLLKKIERLLDQPKLKHNKSLEEIAKVNQVVNLKIIKALEFF
ncbi:hypothetical protein ACFX5K_00875 [Rickettsiales bacterium LUAb2]